MVRDRRLLSLEEAVRKATSLPASVFSLPGKGVIREGADADIVVFRPDALADLATWQEPLRYSVGVDLALRGGVVAWGASGVSPLR
jgi:N-acyl-D-amino-acid deacylase